MNRLTSIIIQILTLHVDESSPFLCDLDLVFFYPCRMACAVVLLQRECGLLTLGVGYDIWCRCQQPPCGVDGAFLGRVSVLTGSFPFLL